MRKNLFQSWEYLASQEIGYLNKINTRQLNNSCEMKDVLQGWIQRCIHARGWYFSLQQSHDYCKAEVRTKIEGQSYQCGKYTDACHEILLTAYLYVLADQRTIAASRTWQHFKGGSVKAFCSAQGDSGAYLDEYKDAVFHGRFCVEEEPTKNVGLFKDKDSWFYVSENGMLLGDRVFYSHDDVGYARLTRSFFGLVGPEHPEQEGLLRFTETGK
jgi:hypothetical protein